MLAVVGGYLLKEVTRNRASQAGLFLALLGLVVLIYGVSFWDVVSIQTAQQSGGLLPPGAGIRLGDGFTLEFDTDGYSYYVNILGVIAGYLLFLGGLSLVEFEAE